MYGPESAAVASAQNLSGGCTASAAFRYLSGLGLVAASAICGICVTLAWPAVARAQVAPVISLNGQLVSTLTEAVAAALPGDVVTVGPGVIALSEPLVMGTGVTIEGASAGATRLEATGLEVGIRVSAGDAATAGATTGIRGLEVSGAVRAIEIGATRGVVIAHVVLRDNEESGLYVGDQGEVTLVNATLLRNGTGVISAGSGVARVKNTVITGGGGGLAAAIDGGLVSSYNDLAGNSGAAYQHVRRGIGDVGYQPVFVDLAQNDLRLTDIQQLTDRGDPADDYSAEPEPNGKRINLGAFGGTTEAELSAALLPNAGGGCAVAGFGRSGIAAVACALLALAAVTIRPRGRARASAAAAKKTSPRPER